jgi:hypothetical protein
MRPNTKLPCVQAGLGAEPVCCGNDCQYGKCKDGVWKDKTKISRGTTEGCGALTSERNGGLMCCYSGEGNPGDLAAAADTGGAATGAEAKAEAGEAAEEPAKTEAAKDEAKTDTAKKRKKAATDAKAPEKPGDKPATKKTPTAAGTKEAPK